MCQNAVSPWCFVRGPWSVLWSLVREIETAFASNHWRWRDRAPRAHLGPRTMDGPGTRNHGPRTDRLGYEACDRLVVTRDDDLFALRDTFQ
jgi:hypothetical protein